MILQSAFNIDFSTWKMGRFIGALLLTITLTSAYATPLLNLAKNGKSAFKIIISTQATNVELTAANVLQQYLTKVADVSIPILKDNTKIGPFEIVVGNTNRNSKATLNSSNDGFLIQSNSATLWLNGSGKNGTLYAVYSFLENYLNCKIYTSTFEIIPKSKTISISAALNIKEQADFSYREVYYPDSKNQLYLDWYRLTRLDDNWGLWVHSFDKLVPSKTYFKQHPEYYALVDGKRKDSQLCLSNPTVFKILSASLKERMADAPAMKYWSVSQNDDSGYCECGLCSAIDKKEDGPQGSILNFVNKVAAQFPDKIISTLAYTYSQRAPLRLKPAKNVQIMLCSIDCNRSKPIVNDPSSASFRRDLKNWSQLTSNLFVWDYNVQFTNYVSPFPNLHVLQSNLSFFKANGVKGVFLQGSGDTPGEFSELRAFLLARLSWNTNANVKKLTAQFLNDYYGKAAPFIQQYIDLLHKNLITSNERLDIYGSPVPAHRSYLSPELLDEYGLLFDQAEDAVNNERTLLANVKAARLPIEFAVLQQSRFYGIQKHGVFVNENQQWIPRANYKRKVANFINTANKAGITELAEGGLSPNAYQKEWDSIFKAGPKIHSAIGAKVIAITPFSDDYFNKGAPTLTDGSRGYLDFQYNWLGWYGKDLVVVVDLGKETAVNQVSISFLEDQRHWAFLPAAVSFSFSTDNINFVSQQKIAAPFGLYENYAQSVQDYIAKLNSPLTARYIKVKASNLRQLPQWRYYKNKQAWLFADEIMVN
ncbi:DUF4838 domain-containing protein [Pedobacter polaris]|nr:DUF4838 domain-containing protein [Pedobacter polaris]